MIISTSQTEADNIKVRKIEASPALGSIALDLQKDRTIGDTIYRSTFSTMYLKVAEAEQIIVALAEHLFDSGEMSREAADRLNYLTHVILDSDREATHAAMDAADYWNES